MRLLSRKAYALLFGGDVILLYAALWLALAVRHLSFPDATLFLSHAVPFSLLFAVWFVIFFMAGLYGRYTLLFINALPVRLFVALMINAALAVVFFFALPWQIAPKWVLVWYVVIAAALLYLWRVVLFPRLRVREEVGAVLVGTSVELSELAEELNRDPVYPIEIRAIVHPELLSHTELTRIITRLVDEGEVSAIIADMGNHALDDLLSFLYDLCFVKQRARFIDARMLYEEVFERVPLALIDKRWVLHRLPLHTHTWYVLAKRMIDVIGAVGLGVVFALVLPVVALLIKLEDGGDVFYVTARVGKGGRRFYLLKFRTMTGKDRGAEVLESKLKVTRVGAWLRRFRIDELPQFFNILRGELSLVGPRPELPSLVKAYQRELPFYHLRHMVTPGLTGWAQVTHRRHPHHRIDVSATEEKLSYDLYYLEHRGLWLDVRILLKTVAVVLQDSRA